APRVLTRSLDRHRHIICLLGITTIAHLTYACVRWGEPVEYMDRGPSGIQDLLYSIRWDAILIDPVARAARKDPGNLAFSRRHFHVPGKGRAIGGRSIGLAASLGVALCSSPRSTLTTTSDCMVNHERATGRLVGFIFSFHLYKTASEIRWLVARLRQ